MPAEKVTTKSENRRSNKPLMEKRRRARINQSLSELKNLILDAMKKDTSRSNKLEKADILEMAVRHLQNLQLQKLTSVSATATTSSEDELGVHQHQKHNKYRAGYNECAKEVSRFLDTVDGIDSVVRGRLVAHLLNCLNEMSSESSTINKGNNNNNRPIVPPACITAKDDDDSGCNVTDYSVSMDMEPSSSDDTSSSSSSSPVSSSVDCPLPVTSTSSVAQPIHIHIPATSIPLRIFSSNGHDQEKGNSPKNSTVVSSPAAFNGLQLIPTRLSTGEFAFVVPNSQSCSPIPTINGTVSSSSSSLVSSISSYPQSSSQNSKIDHIHHARPSSSCGYSKRNKPIPLVIKDESVWRPW